MPKAGDRPGKGTYCCTRCETEVELREIDATLPPCPTCEKIIFFRCNLNMTLKDQADGTSC